MQGFFSHFGTHLLKKKWSAVNQQLMGIVITGKTSTQELFQPHELIKRLAVMETE